VKKLTISFILLFLLCPLFSQGAVSLLYKGSDNYILTERTDLRRYENNKYIGLTSREVKAFICPQYKDDQRFYEGYFYVEEDTMHLASSVNEGIHDAISASFSISQAGQMLMYEDNGYPSFRSFPSFPEKEIKKGDIWTAKAVRAVDPSGEGKITRMPIYVQYTYAADQTFNSRNVYLLKASWATRYGNGSSYFDPEGDPQLKSASGKHEASLYIDCQSGAALLIRDSVDESFNYMDGRKIAYKGTISLFTDYPSGVNEEEILPEINRMLAQEDSDIEYEKTDLGYMLIIRDLQFVANSPELLPDEKNRLDQIAALLKKVPENQILIEGHTARVGDPSDEMELSLKRAHTIVKELEKRGLSKDNLITKGSGGSKPLADNATPEGRARNRRVEITILN